MEAKMRALIMVAIALVSLSTVSATEGLAVYYPRPYYPAACAGYTEANTGVMIAGVRDELWDNGRACGRIYTVRCTRAANPAPHPCRNGVVRVKVVDYCRYPCNGVLNLSLDAFQRIADPQAGKVWVDYH